MTVPSRADADLDLAVKGIVASRICFSGQVCNCCERVYVHESIRDKFLNKLVAAMESTSQCPDITRHRRVCSMA